MNIMQQKTFENVFKILKKKLESQKKLVLNAL